MSSEPILAIFAHDRVKVTSDGAVMMSRKSDEGLKAFARYWPGRVRAVFRPSETPPAGLDTIQVQSPELPYDLRVSDYSEDTLPEEVARVSVVLAGIGYGFTALAEICEAIGVPCVYMTELTLATERQMAKCTCRNPLRRWRNYQWLRGQERRNAAAIRRAAGIQCNGVPTYNAYAGINPNALLFFDSRLTEPMLADVPAMSRPTDGPLRLAFSGRLLDIKGVDHLPLVAADLRRLGIEFTMAICGDGPMRGALESQIGRLGLEDHVVLKGNMDFVSELMPFMKTSVDLFVCCHRQGDPSCTYLETMGCGVPIVGYDNEAFLGICSESQSGWVVPMDRPKAMARRVAELAADRGSIRDAAQRSLDFARNHCFEDTFRRRAEHLAALIA